MLGTSQQSSAKTAKTVFDRLPRQKTQRPDRYPPPVTHFLDTVRANRIVFIILQIQIIHNYRTVIPWQIHKIYRIRITTGSAYFTRGLKFAAVDDKSTSSKLCGQQIMSLLWRCCAGDWLTCPDFIASTEGIMPKRSNSEALDTTGSFCMLRVTVRSAVPS